MIISLSLSLLILGIFVVNAALEVGTGIYDITGPSVEINFMGYALPGQRGQGRYSPFSFLPHFSLTNSFLIN